MVHGNRGLVCCMYHAAQSQGYIGSSMERQWACGESVCVCVGIAAGRKGMFVCVSLAHSP